MHRARLLVDGYNIVGTWEHLKNLRDHHGLESARTELIEALISYAAHQALHTTVVFDAQYQKTPGYTETHGGHLQVHYTGFAQTADTYIEKLCAQYHRYHRTEHSRLIVATSDHDHGSTALGYGAEWISAQKLQVLVDKSRKKLRDRQKKHPPASGGLLMNHLDHRVQEQLQRLRRGLP